MPPFLDESDTTVNFSDKPRRGRPKKQSADSLDTRSLITRRYAGIDGVWVYSQWYRPYPKVCRCTQRLFLSITFPVKRFLVWPF